VNASVIGATDIYRTDQDGTPYKDGGGRLGRADARYWSISPVTIPIAAFVMFFKVTIPEPGEYDVVLTVQSPDLYDKGDHFYRDTLVARERSP
jgi:hypothetical protein